ncbi:hypothetical protein V2J09_000446 [Rumex salicifolius]
MTPFLPSLTASSSNFTSICDLSSANSITYLNLHLQVSNVAMLTFTSDRFRGFRARKNMGRAFRIQDPEESGASFRA